jgi:hypothetical protein
VNLRWLTVIFVPLLAGCTNQGQLQSGDPSASLVSPDEGLVRGIVLDDQQLPVAEALIGLLTPETNRTTTSGPDGAFQFEAVTPGEYDLVASKIGYVTA